LNLHHLSYIRHLAQFDDVPMQRKLQLNRIANALHRDEQSNQGPVACTLDESVTVAYIVYRLLRPAEVSH
jgi:hypothetical protein